MNGLQTVKLVYIGRQYTDETATQYIRLWNIFHSPDKTRHPDGSTLSLTSLKGLGVIK